MSRNRWLQKAALIIIMILALLITTGRAAAAQQTSGNAGGIFDGADLLTDSEEQALKEKLSKYAEKYEADIAIVTTADAGGQTAQAYADAYAEKLGQSMTADEYPGILFLIDMDNREIYIATQGKAIGWYDEKRIDKILDNCYDHIIEGEYKATCGAFLKGIRDYMGREAGRSARMDIFGVLIRLVIALVVGAAATFAMVHKRGGRVTTSAATYFNAAQSHLNGKEDHFINRTVTRRHIPKPQNNGGHGGGSSGGGGVHMSSGGGAHGGGGRKF